MHPPISSPFGDSEDNSNEDDRDFNRGIRLDYRLSRWCVPRKSIKELIVVPANLGSVLLTATVFAAIIYPVFRAPLLSFFEFWIVSLCGLTPLFVLLAMPFFVWETRSEQSIILTSHGVIHLQGKTRMGKSWRVFLPIIVWSGDVILSTPATSVFLPREAFASREEAREFAQIARDLRRTRGASWRDEWNGQILGSLAGS